MPRSVEAGVFCLGRHRFVNRRRFSYIFRLAGKNGYVCGIGG